MPACRVALAAWAHLPCLLAGVSDACTPVLARLGSLQRLHLDTRAVTDAGLEKLSAATTLTCLDLFGAKVTDRGCVHLRHAFPRSAPWSESRRARTQCCPWPCGGSVNAVQGPAPAARVRCRRLIQAAAPQPPRGPAVPGDLRRCGHRRRCGAPGPADAHDTPEPGPQHTRHGHLAARLPGHGRAGVPQPLPLAPDGPRHPAPELPLGAGPHRARRQQHASQQEALWARHRMLSPG